MDVSDLERAAGLLVDAGGTTVAFTGAGMSAESGIPTFRGAGGIWDEYPPSVYGTPWGLAGAFVTRFGRVRQFMLDASRTFLDAGPNPGHLALAEMERRGLLRAVVTQNVDALHQDAGHAEVVELHGSFFAGRCWRCGHNQAVGKDAIRTFTDRLEQDGKGRISFARAYRRHAVRCAECGGVVRPAVVLFGEGLPGPAYERACALAEGSKLLLIIGTALEVRPASDIPYAALQRGTAIVEINPEPTAITPMADVFLRGRAGEVLPRLLEVS